MSILTPPTKRPDPAPSRPIPAVSAWILTAVLGTCLVVGSFFDLQISEALYNPENAFGIFGAAYGEYPFSLAMLVGGVMVIMFRSRQKTLTTVAQVTIGGLFAVAGAGMTVVNPNRYVPGAPAFIYVLDSLIVAGVVGATIYVLRGVDRNLGMRVAIIILAVVVVELLIINVVKIGWQRPRMRMITDHPEATFAPWWSPGNPERAALRAEGVAAEEFKSFPSGHTANAAVLMMLTAFTVLKARWRQAAPWLFWVGVGWAALIAVSRIIVGAHFLTDVTAGFAITFVCILVAYRIGLPAPSADSDDRLSRSEQRGAPYA